MNDDNWVRIENTDNRILRAIANACGAISHFFLEINLKWGTFYRYEEPVKKKAVKKKAPAKKVAKKAATKKKI
jgi:hypothetical protein